MTDTTTQSLAEWLLDRIAEDEAAARAATPGPWNAGSQYADANVWAGDDHSEGIAHASWEYDESSAANFTHIARHDPARVLAECAAKRAIVEACEPIYGADGWEYDDAPELAWATLRALASVYADHAGFREGWAL